MMPSKIIVLRHLPDLSSDDVTTKDGTRRCAITGETLGDSRVSLRIPRSFGDRRSQQLPPEGALAHKAAPSPPEAPPSNSPSLAAETLQQ